MEERERQVIFNTTEQIKTITVFPQKSVHFNDYLIKLVIKEGSLSKSLNLRTFFINRMLCLIYYKQFAH